MTRSARLYRFCFALLLPAVLLAAPGIELRAQEDLEISCPVSEVTTGVMTNLPEDWWSTPQLGRLDGAEIRQIGGQTVLTCLYRIRDREVALMRRPPAGAMSCQLRPAGIGFSCKAPEKLEVATELQGKICQASIQNQIAWDYQGRRRWQASNLERICKGAENSLQPGVCFDRVMHGNISHGSGTRWRWPPALKLCAGTLDSQATIACFVTAIEAQQPWQQAIEACRAKP